MARFLFATWEAGGQVQPLMLVARAMTERGHDVLVMSDACNSADAAAYGLPFRAWSRAPSRPDKSPATDPLRDWEHGSPLEVITGLCEAVIAGPAAAYAADTQAALDAFAADVVVSQESLFGVMAAAQARRVPLALLAANIWPWPTLPGAPPFGAGMPPAADDDTRDFQARVSNATRGAYQIGLPALNAAREALGLTQLEDLFDQLGAAERILLATSAAFDFDLRPPPPFAYVGPYVADPAWAGEAVSVGGEGPLVLVSFSSMYQAQEPVIRRVIAALGELQARGLVTLGPVLSAADFPAPPNVTVVASAPHGPLLPDAAVFVTHCGHASTLRPLMAGVPLLCLPMGRDQEDNAARAVAAGAGLRLARDAGSEEIRGALATLLADPAYRQAAQAFGARISRDAEGRSAEAVLEALALPSRDVAAG
jgi:UDP:flavonoid glycosyltransferase YjiC (YdhE family)